MSKRTWFFLADLFNCMAEIVNGIGSFFHYLKSKCWSNGLAKTKTNDLVNQLR